MKALIQELVAKANLDTAQPKRSLAWCVSSSAPSCPRPCGPHLDAALNGERIEGAVDAAKSSSADFLK